MSSVRSEFERDIPTSGAIELRFLAVALDSGHFQLLNFPSMPPLFWYAQRRWYARRIAIRVGELDGSNEELFQIWVSGGHGGHCIQRSVAGL